MVSLMGVEAIMCYKVSEEGHFARAKVVKGSGVGPKAKRNFHKGREAEICVFHRDKGTAEVRSV